MKPAEEMTDSELDDEIEWAALHLQSKRLDQRAKFEAQHRELTAERDERRARNRIKSTG